MKTELVTTKSVVIIKSTHRDLGPGFDVVIRLNGKDMVHEWYDSKIKAGQRRNVLNSRAIPRGATLGCLGDSIWVPLTSCNKLFAI